MPADAGHALMFPISRGSSIFGIRLSVRPTICREIGHPDLAVALDSFIRNVKLDAAQFVKGSAVTA